MKTRKRTATFAAIAAFLLAALLAVCLPWRAPHSASALETEQSGGKYYARQVKNTVDIAYFSELFGSSYTNAAVGVGSYAFYTRDLYMSMMPIKKLTSYANAGTEDGIRAYCDGNAGNFSYAAYRVNNIWLSDNANLNEMKFTFSFKFDGETDRLSFGNYDCSAAGTSTWNYRLYIAKDGTVSLGTPKLHLTGVQTKTGQAGVSESWTDDDVLGTGEQAHTNDFGEFQTGKVYRVEYTVQRLFDTAAAATDDVTIVGTSSGMRQTVSISSQDDGDFAANTLSADFDDQNYQKVTCEKVNNSTEIGELGYTFMLAVPKGSETVSVASYNYADDYTIADYEGNAEEVEKMDISEAIPSMKSTGMTSEDAFYTADGVRHDNFWKTKLITSDGGNIINKRMYMRLDVSKTFGNNGHGAFLFALAQPGSESPRQSVDIYSPAPAGNALISYAQRTPLGFTEYYQSSDWGLGASKVQDVVFVAGVDNYHSAKTGHNFQIANLWFIDYNSSDITGKTSIEEIETALGLNDVEGMKSSRLNTISHHCIRLYMEQPESFYNGEKSFAFMQANNCDQGFDIKPVFFNRTYNVTVDEHTEQVTYGSSYDLREWQSTPDYCKLTGIGVTSGAPLYKTGSMEEKSSFTVEDLQGAKWDYEPTYDEKTGNDIVLSSSIEPIDYKIKYHVGTRTYGEGGDDIGGKLSQLNLNDEDLTVEGDLYAPTPEDIAALGEDMRFFGWYTKDTATSHNDDDKVTDDKLNVRSLVPDANKHDDGYVIELWAYCVQGYTVTFQYPDDRTKEKSIIEDESITFADFASGADIDEWLRGYDLSGWEKSTGDTWVDVTGESETPNANVTYRAKATLHNYTINYLLDDGTNNSVNPATFTVKSDPIEFAAPEKAGYFFVRWHLGTVSGDEITGIGTGTKAEDVTVAAEYKQNTLPSSLTVAVGETSDLPFIALTDGSLAIKVSGPNVADEVITATPPRYTFAAAGSYTLTYEITMPYASYTHTVAVTAQKPVITVNGTYAQSYATGTVLTLLGGSVSVDGGTVNVAVTRDGNPVAKSEDGSTVTLAENGTYTVTYSYAGADSVTFTFTVAAPSAGKKGCGGCNNSAAGVAAGMLALIGASIVTLTRRS